MTAKWLDRRSISWGLGLSILVGGATEAQLVNGQWRAAPQQGARVAMQVNAPTVFAQQVFNPMLAPRQPVQFALVPTIVMSDGSVYANYGYGYQQVVTCTPAVVAPYGVYGNGTVANATNTQPVPNQQTRSQQMVATNATAGGQMVRSPCAAPVTQAPMPAVGRRY